MRDLTDASPTAIAAERARVPREGIGEAILACQGSDGSWHRANAPVWLPTLYTLLFLRSTGVDRADPSVESAVARLEAGYRWDKEFGEKPFFEGEVEPCINGGTLALGAYFGHPAESLARRLVGEQLDDGGWNCEAPKSVRSSFHTTICVLEGLLEYERAVGAAPEVASARRRGEEYLLERALFRLALDRRGRESGVPEVRVPAPLSLRRPPCARLPQGRRCSARHARRGCLRGRRRKAAGRRSMAPRWRVRRGACPPVRRIGGSAESVEHAPGPAGARLVRAKKKARAGEHPLGQAFRSASALRLRWRWLRPLPEWLTKNRWLSRA